jgi:hypothetical protein
MLYNGFEDDSIVLLDGAPYFQVSAVMDPAAGDDPAFVTSQAYSPELNRIEECWRQLQTFLSKRFSDSLGELTTAIDTALNSSFQKRALISNGCYNSLFSPLAFVG